MIDFIKKSMAWALSIITVVFTFVPESFFLNHRWLITNIFEKSDLILGVDPHSARIVISRILAFLLVWIVTMLLYALFLKVRRHRTIKGQNYSIRVEYGNILKKKRCKRVINFDECFTTQVGNATADINPTSICGQYLTVHPDLDIQQLIEAANIVPEQSKSKYHQKTRYTPGTIVPNGDDLLMAFAKLDERGKGRFSSRDEYLDCLDRLWKELENYYSEVDVCIPILGAGTTAFEGNAGASYSQQELLDMMILSYKLSSHKIKSPHKLRIVCKKTNGFTINKIGD